MDGRKISNLGWLKKPQIQTFLRFKQADSQADFCSAYGLKIAMIMIARVSIHQLMVLLRKERCGLSNGLGPRGLDCGEFGFF